METTCPSCGGRRWELVKLENRVVHIDVDTSTDAAAVERIHADRATGVVVGATCDSCGHHADPVQVGHIQAAAAATPRHELAHGAA